MDNRGSLCYTTPMNKRWRVILTVFSVIILAAVFTTLALQLRAEQQPATSHVEQQQDAEPDVTPDMSPEAHLKAANTLRKEHNAPPLELSSALNQSAQEKCDDMVTHKYYEHDNPSTGVKGYTIASDALGLYGHYSENLQGEYQTNIHHSESKRRMTMAQVFDSWMNSESHRKALLDPDYTLTGFAVCGPAIVGDGAQYWLTVEHFYSPTMK